MGASVISGPAIVSGDTSPIQNMDPDVGPSLTYQGGHLLDVRQIGGIGSAPGLPGIKMYGLWSNPYITLVDGVPITKSNTNIAAAAATVAATPMALATAQASGISIGIPIVPFGSAINAANKVTPALALDFGFTTATATAASATLTALPAGAWKFFRKGMKIIVAGAGGANLPLFTSVLTTPAANATTLAMADAAVSTQAGAQVGTADPSGISAWPYAMGGNVVAIADGTQMIGRAVAITGNAGSTAQNFTVVGYDAWGQPQSEVIAFAGGAATTNGKKAFKYIVSVTPSTTDAGHLLSVGTTDIFGFTMRSDFWEYVNIYYNGAFITSSTGWTVADSTDPATTVTGDSRGTYAVQSASDGTKRLAIFMSIPVYNLINATNLSYKTMFGVTPV